MDRSSYLAGLMLVLSVITGFFSVILGSERALGRTFSVQSCKSYSSAGAEKSFCRLPQSLKPGLQVSVYDAKGSAWVGSGVVLPSGLLRVDEAFRPVRTGDRVEVVKLSAFSAASLERAFSASGGD
ncbi:MAG: hypothetical protein H6618_04685 [Deltaproteobacteria bacterium]|nr:hypothetical protein [Deltaproteobacteria bacterium]